MKINVGIIGYGNLGKAVEENILADTNFKLKAIFSRRCVVSKHGTLVEPYDRFIDYKNKIDVMILCGGSKNDLEIQTPEILKYFDIINSFDTHSKIKKEYFKIDKIAKQVNHRAIICCGWDPGLLSNIRAMFLAISKNTPHTFWGKGVSMGHSDAIRQVTHVDDGIQFTIPVESEIKNARYGIISNNPKHERECYVVANTKYHNEIERNIKNIPNYFKGQPTKIHFVSHEKILKLKQNMKHKGMVFSHFKTKDNECKLSFSVSMKSNPDFTAKIMLTYVTALINLKNSKQVGCFTHLDIPTKYLFYKSKWEDLLKTIC